MQDISSNISISIVSKKILKIISTSSYNYVKIDPPVILNDLDEIIGTTVLRDPPGSPSAPSAPLTPSTPLEYDIVYSAKNYIGMVTFRIPTFTMIADKIYTNFSPIEMCFMKLNPVIEYILPPLGVPLEFKPGFTIKMKIYNGFPTGRIPLTINSPVNFSVKSISNNIFRDGNNIYFVNAELFDVYEEEITLIPTAMSITTAGQPVVIEVENTASVSQIPSINNYNFRSPLINTTILNLVQNITTGIYYYPLLNLKVSMLRSFIFKLDVSSDDPCPIFELRNHTSEFNIDSSGVITKNASTLPGNYDLDIVVRDVFGNEVFVILQVCLTNALECNDRCISASLKITCPVDETKHFSFLYSNIADISYISFVIIQLIDILVQNLIHPDFKTDGSDLIPLSIFLAEDRKLCFTNLLKCKIPGTMIPGTLIDRKFNYFSDLVFDTFKKIIIHTLNSSRSNNFKIVDCEMFSFELDICLK